MQSSSSSFFCKLRLASMETNLINEYSRKDDPSRTDDTEKLFDLASSMVASGGMSISF